MYFIIDMRYNFRRVTPDPCGNIQEVAVKMEIVRSLHLSSLDISDVIEKVEL